MWEMKVGEYRRKWEGTQGKGKSKKGVKKRNRRERTKEKRRGLKMEKRQENVGGIKEKGWS